MNNKIIEYNGMKITKIKSEKDAVILATKQITKFTMSEETMGCIWYKGSFFSKILKSLKCKKIMAVNMHTPRGNKIPYIELYF